MFDDSGQFPAGGELAYPLSGRTTGLGLGDRNELRVEPQGPFELRTSNRESPTWTSHDGVTPTLLEHSHVATGTSSTRPELILSARA
jgi:hypothetical protein